MSFERNAVERGTLGVRYEKARRNESKLLPTDRMGLSVDDEGFCAYLRDLSTRIPVIFFFK